MIGMPVGGKHTGQRNSLAQYLAKELSHRIKSDEITHIEGEFMANMRLVDLCFDGN